jgi:uridine kinase
MFDDLFVEANLVLNTDDIYYKFDEWKPQKNKNILLVTGLSGSGKSTLANDLYEKYKAKVVYLDAFDQLDTSAGNTYMIEDFFAKKKIDYTQYKRVWDIPDIEYDNILNEFFEFCVSEIYKDPHNLYIIEGLQLYAYIDKAAIENLPMVIKGTSYLTSQYRRLMRDNSDSKNVIRPIISELKHIGLAAFKINLKDQRILKKLKTELQPKKRGSDGMFGDLLREASMPNEYYLPNDGGKIKAFEDAFGDDEIKKSIAYGFSSSHEYDAPEKKKDAVKSCIKFVNNYDWKKRDHKVEDIEAFNKPLNMKKVYNIAKTIEEKGNTEPLITVDKIHGFNWQSKGKSILTDGNHRLGAIKVLEQKTCPVYHGIYSGNAERDHQDFLPTIEDDSEVESDEENSMHESSNFITEAVFENVDNVKNFFIESANEFKLLQEASKKRKIERVSLTEEERAAVEAKYGKNHVLFAKDGKSGKYYCAARATSKLYDSPTDIPMDAVRFVASTA